MRLALWLAAAIVLAGIGHSFVAFQRDVYPLDGYMYYAAAAILFAWALRSVRRAPGVDWSALREPLRRIVVELRRLAWAVFKVDFGPTLFLGLAALNLISAAMALVIDSVVVFAGWAASVVWLAAAIWPHLPRIAVAQPALLEAPAAIVEPEETSARFTPRAAVVVVGALAVVVGQIVISGESVPGAFGVLGDAADSIAEALRLALPGDPAPAVIGLAVLIAGAAVFGAATRGVALVDRPRLIVEAGFSTRPGGEGRRLAFVAAGMAAWAAATQSAAGGATGIGPVALWVTALVLIGAVWRKIDIDRGVRLSVSVERREAYALIALLIGMLAIWLVQLDRLPASIWGDEGAYWTLARDIAAGRFPVNLFGLGAYSYPAGGSVYQSIWLSLFGPTVWAWRVASALAVIASSVPLYFLARGLLGRRVAFVALAFFASSPLALAYGRIGYLYALSIFPVVTSAAFSVAAVLRDSRLCAFLAGVAGGAGFMLYPSARFGIALCILLLVTFAVARMARRASLVRLGLSFGSAVIVAAAPALAYGLFREPEAFADKWFESSMANVLYAESVLGRDELLARASFASTRSNQLFFEPSLYAPLALRGWLRTAIGLHRPGLATEHYVVGPLAGPLALPYLLGLAWCLARGRRPGYSIWSIWLLAGTFLLSAIETFPPHTTDLLPMLPALAVLAAIGVVGLLDTLRRFWPALSWRVEIGLLLAATIGVSAISLWTYFVEMPQRYKPNLEMSMFWSALDLSRGSTVAFVRDEAYTPDFTPWGLQNFDTGVAWLMIDPAQLSQADLRPACATSCRVFYTPRNAVAVEAQLREVLGIGEVTPYINTAGAVIGYAYNPAGKP